MKIAKLSLACAVALGIGSNFAQAEILEEAIKGVTVDGMLRYRFQSDNYQDMGGKAGIDNTNTTNQYRALANISTAPIKNVSAGVGILYINEGATTGTGTLGGGLGAGEDGDFGVNTFTLTYAPHNVTNTTVILGKQLLGTPVTDASDYDRAVGALVLNQDIKGLTLAGGAFGSWSLSNMAGYGGSILNTGFDSVNKGLFALAAIYGIPNLITAQLWWFNAQDISDTTLYANIAYDQNFGGAFGARVGVTYGLTKLNDGDKTALTQVGAYNTLVPEGNLGLFGKQETDNDLLKINAGVTVGPAVLDVNYMMNTKPGYSVMFDDMGAMIDPVTMGQIWWQDASTRTSLGVGRRIISATGGALGAGGGFAMPVIEGAEDSLSVITASIGAKNILNTGLGIHLTYVTGSSEYKKGTAHPYNGLLNSKREFQEITPLLNYQFSEKLSFQTFYAMLSTDITQEGNITSVNAPTTNTYTGQKITEKRNRYRFQALYKF
ncbi:MAG: major outer membrane protein [Helicobacter sp.]|nr:major outer membrane protein [Helicobacter sp.]